MTASPGQTAALATLESIARASDGALRVGVDLVGENGWLRVRLWLASASLVPARESPMLREWEPIDIFVPPDYPLAAPVPAAGHGGFDGKAHVQWGREICLYGSETDWDPSGGMVDFIRRLLAFYRDLARDTLQGPVLPWDRPIAYHHQDAGFAILAADLPKPIRTGRSSFLTWAIGTPTGHRWADVSAWLTEPVAGAGEDAVGPLSEAIGRARTASDAPLDFLVPAVVLDRPIGFEYPDRARELLEAIMGAGIPLRHLMTHLAVTANANRLAAVDDDEPQLLLLVRAPADRRFTIEDDQAYFALWRIQPEDSGAVLFAGVPTGDDELGQRLTALESVEVTWAKVYDTRPEVVVRRDSGRPVSRLAGLRILVLGCGALGAPIAEHCVRAAASQVDVVDPGFVTPGILVRQPYQDADLGTAKASALAARLRSIQPHARVRAGVKDAVRSGLLTEEFVVEYDVVIDATANRAVAVRLEQIWREGTGLPSLVSVGIGRSATVGVATVTPPGARAAGVDLLRRLAIAATADDDLADVRSEFFPDDDVLDFFPEQGCSSSTFVGSAADVNALAGLLLNESLSRLGERLGKRNGVGDESVMAAVSVVRGCPDDGRPGAVRLPVEPDRVLTDPSQGFQVRIAPEAFQQLYQHVAAAPGAGSESPSETGGLLLGQLDEACRVAWVTQVAELPEGSESSPTSVVVSPAAARAIVRRQSERTSGRLGFIGYWHSHPRSDAMPSPTDRVSMTDVVEDDETLTAVLLLVAGIPEMESGALGRGAENWSPPLHAEVFVARSRNDDELLAEGVR